MLDSSHYVHAWTDWRRQYLMPDLNVLHRAILNGDDKEAVAVVKKALSEGIDPMALINNYMIPAMDETGKRFEAHEYFVPELLLSARAMKRALELLQPLLLARGAQPTGRVVIGTVKGDLHDIGKNLVATLLEGAGFEVIDLGTDVPPERFIEEVNAKNANIIALSTLLTVTLPAMRMTVEAISQAGLRNRAKIMVGGAPVTREYAEIIGADGYGENASVAVSVARTLISL